MKDLISIIVPVYNVEKYLDKCLKSIINQTYQNIEIIIVDDGSTDSSKKICDNYKKIDKRVKVFHIKNTGLSGARNYGIKKCSGKYISFIDSDDYIEKDMIEILYKNIKCEKADLSCCSFYEVFKNKIEKKNKKIEYFVMNSTEAIEKSFLDEGLSVYTWNKLYNKKLFKNIEFPLHKKSQDRFIMYQVFNEAEKIVYESTCKYYYIQRKDSAANNLVNINTDSIEASFNSIDYLKDNKRLQSLAIKDYLLTKLRCYKKKVYYKKKDDIKLRKELIEEFSKYKNIPYTNKEKLEIFIFKYFKQLYKKIGRIYYNKKYKKMY